MRILLIFISLITYQSEFQNYNDEGYASYYAKKFEGRKTASGEIYRSNKYTAAHKKIPFGTFVKVTNIKNDSNVIVKINDRLGKKSPHVLDLSLIAAKKLNFIREGKAKVRLELVKNDTIK